MNFLIVEDEAPARKELRFLIESYAAPVQFREAKNGREALEMAKTHQFDAAFIDINLGDLDGIALARHLLELQPNLRIVFATAYDAYALKAFELHALDYLVKPFEPHRVEMAINRIQNDTLRSPGTAASGIQRKVEKIRKISLWNGDRVILIDIAEIVLIATSDRFCRICTLKDVFSSGQPLGYFEQKLHDGDFLRVNRSYLVNLEHILEILPWFNHSYLLKMRKYEDEEIVISRNKIKYFRLLFDF
jgi:DNA-binding LytR/AlgR family response regulator